MNKEEVTKFNLILDTLELLHLVDLHQAILFISYAGQTLVSISKVSKTTLNEAT